MPQGRFSWTGILIIATWTISSGCAPPAIDGDFDSGNPSSNIYAMVEAANSGDTTSIPRIIEYLDSADPAVRFVAILSLRDLTGQDLGYHYYDKRRDRREAILRWIDWYETEYNTSVDFDEHALDDDSDLSSAPIP